MLKKRTYKLFFGNVSRKKWVIGTKVAICPIIFGDFKMNEKFKDLLFENILARAKKISLKLQGSAPVYIVTRGASDVRTFYSDYYLVDDGQVLAHIGDSIIAIIPTENIITID